MFFSLIASEAGLQKGLGARSVEMLRGRDQLVLQYLEWRIPEGKIPPTSQEIAYAMGMPLSTVRRIILRLIAAEKISRCGRRAIRLI